MKAALRALGVAAALAVGCASAPAAQAPPFQLKGEWQQGGVVVGHVAPGTRLWLDGKPLHVAATGDFVLGLDRDAGGRAELAVLPPQEKARQQRYVFTVAKRQWQVQRIDGLPGKVVTPPKSEWPRIARESALARAARERDSERLDFARPFIWPCVGRISGVFGSQRILNGIPKSPHYGVDVAVPVGTPVRAPAGGVISLAQPDFYYSGGTIVLDHGLGLSSTFMHLSKLLVKEGDEVRQGQVIALSGMTGRATGPHLHWSLSWFDVRVDAQPLAGPMPALPEEN